MYRCGFLTSTRAGHVLESQICTSSSPSPGTAAVRARSREEQKTPWEFWIRRGTSPFTCHLPLLFAALSHRRSVPSEGEDKQLGRQKSQERDEAPLPRALSYSTAALAKPVAPPRLLQHSPGMGFHKERLAPVPGRERQQQRFAAIPPRRIQPLPQDSRTPALPCQTKHIFPPTRHPWLGCASSPAR